MIDHEDLGHPVAELSTGAVSPRLGRVQIAATTTQRVGASRARA
jgi:hypothetical protein